MFDKKQSASLQKPTLASCFGHVLWCVVRDNYSDSKMYRNFALVILNEVQHISGLPLSTKTQLEGYILPVCDKK